MLKRDISELETMNSHLRTQHQLYTKDVLLSQNEFAINQKLFNDKVIAKLDLNREESKLLAKKLPLKTIETSILANNAQIRSREREILELEKQVSEQKENFKQSINTLGSAISQRKNRYVLVSPSAGKVVFYNNLQEKENVKINTELFQIFENSSTYVGALSIPQHNSGKIEVGQRVMVKFQSYPFEEYGIVEDKIGSLPKLSDQDKKSFFALVELPNGLKKNHNKISPIITA